MNISLLEPLGVKAEVIDAFGQEMEKAGHSFTWYAEKAGSVDELIARSKDQEIIMIANSPYPAEVIEANPQIKLIAVAFTGIDHVGLEACKKQDIVVTNCAGYSDTAVAELVIGQVLSVMRKICEGDRVTRAGGTSAGLMGTEIADKTVGIIGCGRIGYRTAKLFQAFGAKVLAWGRTPKSEHEQEGIEYVSLEELMRLSDVVSLHLPNTADTRAMIDEEKLSMMKEGAIFVNCARGPIVDSNALAKLLKSGRIRAALDVFDTEPPLADDYVLRDVPNALLTPHVAFLTEEAMQRRAVIEFDNVRAFLAGSIQNQCKL